MFVLLVGNGAQQRCGAGNLHLLLVQIDLIHAIYYYSIVTTTRSNNVLQMLDQFDAIKDNDYQLLNVQQPVKQGGVSIKKEYTLHPRLFKLCLMRSKNNQFLNQPIAL